MKPSHLSRSFPKFSPARRALVQPRFLLSAVAMGAFLAGGVYFAKAQNAPTPVKMQSASGPTTTASSGFSLGPKPVSLSDLPSLVQAFGAAKGTAKAVSSSAKTGNAGNANVGTANARTASAVTAQAIVSGANVSGFNLTDVDLTPNSPSDEREPMVSPTGDFIAFRSNGTDNNGDGLIDALNAEKKYHVWVISSDGRGARQISGLGSDKLRNQFRPAWSPDGNQLVYVDGEGTSAQLYVAEASLGSASQPEQRTFFSGEKASPVWNPSGASIVFACKTNPATNPPTNLGQFDLFSIDTDGNPSSARRLTGGSNDVLGAQVDDLNPTFSASNTQGFGYIYFSSNRTSTAKITPRRIWRLDLNSNSSPMQISAPVKRVGGSADDSDDYPTTSLSGSFTGQNVPPRLAFQTTSALSVNDRNQADGRDLNIWALPINNVAERDGEAYVLSNSFSSPETAPGGVNGSQDKSSDREPTFGRAISSSQAISTIAFASNRINAPNPTVLVAQNPQGGVGTNGTHDIWTTVTADTTPPILIPQGAGNAQTPVVAPGPQSPFTAPRTYEEGLRAGVGGALKLGIVISERQAGLTSVQAIIRDASRPIFAPLIYGVNPSTVNDKVSLNLAIEQGSEIVDVQNLTFVDNGATGEKQANAVAGDGVYYCFSNIKPPANPGDFYIDIVATDRLGNSFTYDNIWGFSTQAFSKANNDLFVSDYTCGQFFPNILSQTNGSGDDGRFANMFPSESYWLSNPAGVTSLYNVYDPMAKPPTLDFAPSNIIADPDTLTNVDIWRILCRGPISANTLNAYRPTTILQLDPNETAAGSGGPFTNKTRNTALAKSAVVWASPYTGTVFAGPGTLNDPATQANLQNYSDAGGRLFVSGRDVAWALTSAGSGNNSFLQNVLGASFSGEISRIAPTPGLQLDPATGAFIRNDSYGISAEATAPELKTLQIGFRDQVLALDKREGDWDDASSNQNPNAISLTKSDGSPVSYYTQSVGVRPDIIVPSGVAGTKTTPAYSIGGQLVGQRISRIKGSIEAKTVFFGFGLEAVNRRYRMPTKTFTRVALDARKQVMRGIYSYLKSGSISGQVINNATNQPIPNFLLRLSGDNGNLYLVRTDAAGNYSAQGLNEGFYQVEPALLSAAGKLLPLGSTTGITSPAGFFSGSTRFTVEVVGGFDTPGTNLRPIPAFPGSLRGKVVAINLEDSSIKTPVNALYILARSKAGAPVFTGGEQFAAVTKTDASGNFAFSGVPPKTDLEVILNPIITDIPEKSGLRAKYQPLQDQNQFTNGQFESRLITGLKRPANDNSTVLQVPSNGTFTLNDNVNDTLNDDGTPLSLDRFVATITGKVTVNGVAVAGVDIQLLLKSNNQPFEPSRTAKTDSAGNYKLSDVPQGSYIIKATIGINSASVTVNVTTNPNVVAPTINIAQPVVSGFVFARLIGTTTTQGPLPNATVKLLDANGNALSPALSTTTANDGSYSFIGVKDGTYKTQASYSNGASSVSSAVSASIVVKGGVAKSADLIITLYRQGGRVINSAGAVQPNAAVELLLGGQSVQSSTTDNAGNFVLNNVLPGSYSAQAISGNLIGRTAVVITNGTTSVPNITIVVAKDATGNLDATNYPGVGQTYYLSVPHEDSNNPESSNVSQASDGFNPATTKVKFAFTVPPIDPTTGTINYTLERYDPVSLTYIPLNGESQILRGYGYRLIVKAKGTSLKLPSTDSTRIALTDPKTEGSFTVTLHTPGAGSANSPYYGYNLIGFGLNPGKYTSVSFEDVLVTHPNGQIVRGINNAATRSWLSSTIMSSDASSGTSTLVTAKDFRPYRGYFVLSRVDGLKLQLRASQSFPANGTYFVSAPYGSRSDIYSTVTIDQAFSLPLSSGKYKVFIFLPGVQVNKRSTITNSDLAPITSGDFLLDRGRGFLLQTLGSAVSLNTPAQNSALIPFQGTEFPISLTWNDNFLKGPQNGGTYEPNNRNNGYNFIGFPFDPALANSISFPNAKVQYGTTLFNTVSEAAAAGILDRQLYVLDENLNYVPLTESTIRPFQGVFVHLLRNDPGKPVTLILRNPLS